MGRRRTQSDLEAVIPVNVDESDSSNGYGAIDDGGSALAFPTNGSVVSSVAPPAKKLGTFMGVFLPCCLSIFGVILFLRLGFIIGDAGVWQTLMMVFLAYAVATMTALSVAAISTNGQMKGGGAYFMISRSLGPEFGGAIGLIFYLANTTAAAMYLLGGAEPFMSAFHIAPDFAGSKYLSQLLIATVVLALLVSVALVGASLFAKSALVIFVLLVISVIVAFMSLLFQNPGVIDGYTGLSGTTFSLNWSPNYDEGSKLGQGSYTFASMFALFFPAITGIMAGANMSGDLKKPGVSIPKGTLGAIGTSLSVYLVLIFVIASTVLPYRLVTDFNILEDVSAVRWLYLPGELCALFASALSSIVGSSRVLQALARDDLIPVLKYFKKGSVGSDEPRRAVLFSWLFVQGFCMIGSLNAIAPLNTMFFLLSYGVVNFACFVHSITGAPNWRPQFKAFSWLQALVGACLAFVTMFVVNPVYGGLSVIFLLVFMAFVHFRAPSTSWGDISQALIYHQVRKFLLKLDQRKDHLKNWRPQVLLLVANPRSSHNLIHFSNNLKKGGLFVVGHVVLSDDPAIGADRLKTELRAYRDYVHESGIKAFPELVMSSSVRGGSQALVLTAGLGGMKPNTVIMGFYEPDQAPRTKQTFFSTTRSTKNTEEKVQNFPTIREAESPLDMSQFVDLMYDCAMFDKNVVLARHFDRLDKQMIVDFGRSSSQAWYRRKFQPWKRQTVERMTVDVWLLPGMADDMTLALLFGHILCQTTMWNRHTRLRVLSFVDYQRQIDAEAEKVRTLLQNCRISADVCVIALALENLASYRTFSQQYAQSSGSPDASSSAAKDGSEAVLLDIDSSAAESATPAAADTPAAAAAAAAGGKFSFGVLSPMQRSEVVNEVVYGRSQNSAVVFMPFDLPKSRPTPEESTAYMRQLTVLTHNLPPTLLVNSRNPVIYSDL